MQPNKTNIKERNTFHSFSGLRKIDNSSWVQDNPHPPLLVRTHTHFSLLPSQLCIHDLLYPWSSCSIHTPLCFINSLSCVLLVHYPQPINTSRFTFWGESLSWHPLDLSVRHLENSPSNWGLHFFTHFHLTSDQTIQFKPFSKTSPPGISLVVQWLRFLAPNAGNLGLIPGQGARFCMPQLRLCMPQLRPDAAK